MVLKPQLSVGLLGGDLGDKLLLPSGEKVAGAG